MELCAEASESKNNICFAYSQAYNPQNTAEMQQNRR